MARRKRKAIPLEQQLAAALACLLPEHLRTVMRNARLPAKSVLGVFTMHHIEFHAMGGSDKWWNLHPMTRVAHAERFGKDVAAVAKVKRLVAKQDRPAPRKDRGAYSRQKTDWVAIKRPGRPWAIRAFPKRDRCWKATPPRDVNHE